MNQPEQRIQTPPAWWKAIGLSVATLYAPFVVMAICTWLFVPCKHCKQTAWALLPAAPGMVVSTFMASRFFHPLSAIPLWTSSSVLTAAAVAVLAYAIRRGGRVKWAGIISTLVIATFLADRVTGSLSFAAKKRIKIG